MMLVAWMVLLSSQPLVQQSAVGGQFGPSRCLEADQIPAASVVQSVAPSFPQKSGLLVWQRRRSPQHHHPHLYSNAAPILPLALHPSVVRFRYWALRLD